MRAFFLAALLFPGAAFGNCATERDLLFSAIERSGWSVADQGSFGQAVSDCRVRGLELTSPTVAVDIGLLEWRLNGLEGLSSGTGDIRLSARVEGLRVTPTVDDPWVAYMLAEQNRRSLINVDMDAEWSLTSGQLDLAALNFDFPGDNALGVAFRVHGLTSAALAGQVGDLATLQIETLGVTVENNGFADGLILGMLVGRMADVPGSPDSVVAATKREIAEVVEGLPNTVFMDGSQDALLRLVADAPVPWGVVRFSLASEPPLPVSRFIPLALDPTSPARIAEAFEGAQLFIDYVPTP